MSQEMTPVATDTFNYAASHTKEGSAMSREPSVRACATA